MARGVVAFVRRAKEGLHEMKEHLKGVGELRSPHHQQPQYRCTYDLTRDVGPGAPGVFKGKIVGIPFAKWKELRHLSETGKSSDQLQLHLEGGKWVNLILLPQHGQVIVSGDLRDA
jgi:hypothetical protein